MGSLELVELVNLAVHLDQCLASPEQLAVQMGSVELVEVVSLGVQFDQSLALVQSPEMEAERSLTTEWLHQPNHG